MHWEKLQKDKQREVSKFDNEAKRRQFEAEKRKRREAQEKIEREKLKQQQELQDLQNRRKSLAESWEKKSGGSNISNNNNVGSTKDSQTSTNVKMTPKKEAGKVKSPRKSQTAKKVSSSSQNLCCLQTSISILLRCQFMFRPCITEATGKLNDR